MIDFLFADRDARDVAAMRISMGILVIVWFLWLWPDLGSMFTMDGPVDIALLERHWSKYRFGPFDEMGVEQLRVVHIFGLGCAIAYTLGWQSRLMNIILVFLLAAYWHRSPWIQNGGDRLLRIFLFYMCFTPSGQAWSIDAWRAGRSSDTKVPVFTIRLVQLQAIVMYTYTGIAKLPGHTWENGTALYYSISDAGYARFPALFDAMLKFAPFRWFLRLSTWVALVWEVAFGPLVIWKKTRAAALIIGLIVHAGIFMSLCVGIFSWASVWSYLAFLPDGWAARLVERVRRR